MRSEQPLNVANQSCLMTERRPLLQPNCQGRKEPFSQNCEQVTAKSLVSTLEQHSTARNGSCKRCLQLQYIQEDYSSMTTMDTFELRNRNKPVRHVNGCQ